jgi:hypothetical protein
MKLNTIFSTIGEIDITLEGFGWTMIALSCVGMLYIGADIAWRMKQMYNEPAF